MSDDELESPIEPSDPETQFIPQEDDDETLWEVIEITAEKGKNYKVRWKGIDPKTQKPWPQSWVAKHDCTDDLVRDWKLRQAKKRKKGSKRESGISKKSRTSTATVKSSGSGLISKATASPSKLDSADSTRRSTSTTIAVTAQRGRHKATIQSPSVHEKSTRSRESVEVYSPSPSHPRSHSPIDVSPTRTIGSPINDNTSSKSVASTKTGTKRKHGETTSATTSARIPANSTFPTAGAEGDARTNNISGSIPPPRKKRKVEVEVVSNYERSTSSAEVDGVGRKRKGRSRVIGSDDDDDYVEVKTESDDIVELGPKPSELEYRKSPSPSQFEAEKEADEADERMIEESLSDIYCTPRSTPLEPSHDRQEEGTPIPPVRPAHRRQDTVEETTPTVSRPGSRAQRELERRMDSPPADLAGTTFKIGPPRKKSTRASVASSSSTAVANPTASDSATESNPTTKFRILSQVARTKSTTGANKRKKAFASSTVSKQQWEELNDFQSQQMVSDHDKSEGGVSEEDPDLELDGMDLDYPVVEELLPPPPPAKSVPDQASSSRAVSAAGSGSNSLTGPHTKPPIPFPIPRSKRVGSSGLSAASSPGIIIPTTPPRNRDSDANDKEDGYRSPILSPGAKKRLARFDKAVMKIALRSGKGKEEEPEDGAILGKVKKGKERKREEQKDEEMAIAGGSGRREHEFVRTPEEKRWKGKEKEQINEDEEQGTSTPKPSETRQKKKAEPLFLPDESDSGDKPAVRSKAQKHEKSKSKSKSLSKETSLPPPRSHDSDSDTNSLVRLRREERAKGKRQESRSKSKEGSKEQVNQRLPSHHGSESEIESSVKSDANARSGQKKTKDMPRHKPVTRSRSRLADTEEAGENNPSSTRIGTANTKPTDKDICNATSKTVSKASSKPQSEVGTNTAQANPPPSTTTVRRSANPRSNSFVNDIIPETEESQSQSQEIQVDMQVPMITSHHPSVPPVTPSRPTLKSRMKPKTPQPKSRPLSRTSSVVGALALGFMDVGMDNGVDENLEDEKVSNKKDVTTTTKSFGPIPRISPSVFRDHLPSSSLPESIVDSIEADGNDAAKRAADRNEEDDSIEQFESPIKGAGSESGGERRVGILNAASRQEREKQRVKGKNASDIWNSDLNRRGQELAEAAKKKEKERLRAEEKPAVPASTSTKLMPRAKNAPFRYLVTEGLDRLPDLQEEEMNPDVSMQSLPPDVILPPEDANSVVQQMEDAYVDLSGGIAGDRIAASASNAAVGASTSVNVGVEGSQSMEAELTVESNDTGMDVDMGTGIVERRLDPIYLRQEEEESTQEEEGPTQDRMMKLRLHQQQLDHIHLRQEEEESAQDLMRELRLHQQQQGLKAGRSGGLGRDDIADLPPAIQIDSQPIAEAMLDEGARKHDADDNTKSHLSVDEIPSIMVEKPSRAASARSYSPLEDEDELLRRKASSRTSKSSSRSRSLSSQKSENEKEPDTEAEIPATASTHRGSLQALSQPADSQTESVENPHHLGAAMHLLNTKSEEISKLEGQLSAAQRTNKNLLQQLSDLRLHLTNDAQSSTKTLEQELAEARAQLALQTASWENERATLVLDLETATRGKVSAEQDRDFFREQYAKASAFVSSVRDENTELEKQIKITANQAQSGVSLIKGTFELRTKSLEEDVRAWRRMAEFLIEKDRRTNDDIRKRAAEEPELRARCDQQEYALEETSERLAQVEMDLEEKQKMYVEAEEGEKRWKEATVRLDLELNEAKTKLERIGKVGIGDGDESNGHEFIYRCQWRPDDSNNTCEAVFLNISELQEHLYTGGHLQPG